jgi:hypothetical protein
MPDRPSILLLTATITPPPGVSARPDPMVRLEDYRKALSFYVSRIGQGIDRIVFGENSESDVTLLQRLVEECGHTDKCEFVVFAGLDYPPTYGYGFGEFKSLDHCMKYSRTICSASERSLITKVTGRYIVRNLMELIRRTPGEVDVLCDIRNRKRPWADLRVMSWTRGGYDRVLSGVHTRLRDDINRIPPEMVFSKYLLGAGTDAKIATRFPIELHVHGMRGYDNRDWSGGIYSVKHYVRACARRLLPWYPV